ncbi:response regulator [Candidatus Micrarchaeota archaeon]|nr:response regulator [Candidatus Micrarchaeota archaeon]
MDDLLLFESRSRFTVLVIEDNAQFAANALEALKGHDVIVVETLDDAAEAIGKNKIDFVLSDVHFPEKSGGKPEAQVSKMLTFAYETATPVCFVTQADHHGLLNTNEGHVSLRALNIADILLTMLEISRDNQEKPEAELFRQLTASETTTIRSDAKTPAIWEMAFQMAQNVTIKTRSIGLAVMKVRGLGLDVKADNGLPKVVPPARIR